MPCPAPPKIIIPNSLMQECPDLELLIEPNLGGLTLKIIEVSHAYHQCKDSKSKLIKVIKKATKDEE